MNQPSNKFYPRSLSSLSKNTPGLQADAFRVRDAGFFSHQNLLRGLKTLTILLFLVISCRLWDALAFEVNLAAIQSIESSGCKNPCIGDSGKALGVFQLHQAVVTDYNRIHNTSYLHQDALDSTISLKIANWYLTSEIPRLLRHFKQPINLETVLTAYNMGVGNVIKGKRATNYISKYRRLTNEP